MHGLGADPFPTRRALRQPLWMVVVAAVTAFLLLATACQTATEVGGNEQADTGQGDTGAMRSPSEVFETARQSVVFVGSAEESRGSGVAIDGGWIVTNAHVVGRARHVRIVTSDGDELGLVPIHGIDPVLDVAVLGPIPEGDAAPVPIEQAMSADAQVGETVYLLGYPDETNKRPVPTLTEGIINRRREVVLRDYTFLQVDASIAPGQSGGALVDTQGRLIGLSGIRFGSAAFGLALATDSLRERVDMLIDGPPIADPLASEPVDEFQGEIGPHRYVAFMTETDGRIEVEVNSAGDAFIEVLSAAGSQKFEDWQDWDYFVDTPRTESDFFRDRSLQGTERLEVEVAPGSYQVLVGSVGRSPASATITSSTPLYPLADVEEGAVLVPGEVTEGEFGWTKDSDKWIVRLAAGDTATITIDGIGDFFGVVRLDDMVISSNDDAAFGVFGLGAKIEFTAETSGDYELEVGTRDVDRHGYFVQLDLN